MASQPAWSKQLNAALHIRATQRVARTDADAAAINLVTRKVWSGFLAFVRGMSPADVGRAPAALARTLEQLEAAVHAEITKQLKASTLWGWSSMRRVLMTHLPPAVLDGMFFRSKAATRTQAKESINEAARRNPDPAPKATARLTLPASPTPEQLQAELFAPPTAAEAAEIIHRPVNGKAWDQRLDDLSKRILDKQSLVDTLSKAIADGKTPAQMVELVSPIVGNYDAAARRISRTEGLRVIDEIGKDQYKELEGEIQGWRREVTLDDVTGVDHRPLNGYIYKQGDEPSLPDRPNCRCWLSPVFNEEKLVALPSGQVGVQELGGATSDLGQYGDWFDQQTPDLQMAAVGKAKYREVEAKIEASGETRAPNYHDFIGPDGDALTLRDLRAETQADWIARRAEVGAAVHAQSAGLDAADLSTIKRGVQLDVRHLGNDLAPDRIPEIPQPHGVVVEPTVPVIAQAASQAVAAAAQLLPQPQAVPVKVNASTPGKAYESASARYDGSVPKHVGPIPHDDGKRAAVSKEEMLQRLAHDPVLDAHVTKFEAEHERRQSKLIARLQALDQKVYEAQRQMDDLRARVGGDVGLVHPDYYKYQREANRAQAAYDKLDATRKDLVFDSLRAVNTSAGIETYSVKLTGDTMDDANRAAKRLAGVIARPHANAPGDDVLRLAINQTPGRSEHEINGTSGSILNLDPHDSRQGLVAIHEAGHAVESQVPGVAEAVEAFLRKRTAGSPAVRMIDVNPGGDYGPTEMGNEDDFKKAGLDRNQAAYTGKSYVIQAKDGTTINFASEVTPMGLQFLANDPGRFSNDREFLRLVVGITTGRLHVVPGVYQ